MKKHFFFSDESWPGVTKLPDFKAQFPRWEPQSLSTLLPVTLSAQGQDLFQVMKNTIKLNICHQPNGSFHFSLQYHFLYSLIASIPRSSFFILCLASWYKIPWYNITKVQKVPLVKDENHLEPNCLLQKRFSGQQRWGNASL